MSRPSASKSLKHIRRKREVTRKLARARVERQYPVFTYDTAHADEAFVTAVRAALRPVRLDDPTLFDDAERVALRTLRADGVAAMLGRLGVLGEGPRADRYGRFADLFAKLGQAVYDRIGPDALGRFLPLSNLMFVPTGTTLRVVCRSLLPVPGRPRLAYRSPVPVTVTFDGVPFRLAFTDHAARRVCERVVPHFRSFTGNFDAFACLAGTREVHPCRLHPDQPAVSIWCRCVRGSAGERIARAILGEGFDPTRDHAFRVGYCPVALDGGWAVAKTLLVPGMRATPEYGTILAARLPRDVRDRLLAAADAAVTPGRPWSAAAPLLRWSHRRGVPQVVPARAEYADMLGPVPRAEG